MPYWNGTRKKFTLYHVNEKMITIEQNAIRKTFKIRGIFRLLPVFSFHLPVLFFCNISFLLLSPNGYAVRQVHKVWSYLLGVLPLYMFYELFTRGRRSNVYIVYKEALHRKKTNFCGRVYAQNRYMLIGYFVWVV